MNTRRILMITLALVALAATPTLAGTRWFCGGVVPVACGGALQATCNSSSGCNSGLLVYNIPDVNINCPWPLPDETVTHGCYDPTNPPTCSQCSANGQYQCPGSCGGKCDAGLTPDSNGFCRPCGSYGERTCHDGDPTCEGGLQNVGGTCYSGCGGPGQPVCPNLLCLPWNNAVGPICTGCGGDPEEPPPGSTQPICLAGSPCRAGTEVQGVVCSNCGQDQEIECFLGDACRDGSGPIGPNIDGHSVCSFCGGPGEVACDGSNCDSGLWLVTDAGLDGDIDECLEDRSADEKHFIKRNGVCWNDAPESMARTAPESWPVDEKPAPGRGTVFLIHGRGGDCAGVVPTLNTGQLYETGQLVYCVEYAQEPEEEEDPPGIDRQLVRILPVLDDCTDPGYCFDETDPVTSVVAPSFDVPGVATGLEQAMLQVRTVGEITLIGQSQGGFIARELIYSHYDELRWHGKKISRVVTLGHPFYAKQTDPHLYTPWLCLGQDNFDCATGKWTWGWDLNAAGSIDNLDYPQIDWTAVSGDPITLEAGQISVSPTDANGDGETDASDEECLVIFGGIAADSVDGDSSVPIESTLGLDEFGTFSASELTFDRRYHTDCQHSGACHLAEVLLDPVPCQPGSGLGQPLYSCFGEDPDTSVLGWSTEPLPAMDALEFDGIDDGVVVDDPAAVAALDVDAFLTLEAWIYAEGTNGAMFINREGEYWLSRAVDGRIFYALADGNWVGVASNYVVPERVWTHVALVFDGGGTQKTYLYINGRLEQEWNTGASIGDVNAIDTLDIGWRATSSVRFDGRLDDVRVWERALTREEVVAGMGDMPGGGNISGLLGWWRFDEEGDTVLDSSGNGFHASLSTLGADAAPTRRRDVRSERKGGALYFSGDGAHVVVDEPTALGALEMSSTMTLEGWLFPRSDDVLNSIIVNKEGEYWLGRWSDGRITFAVANSSPGWVAVKSTFVAPLREWTHVSFIYDEAASTATLYINGQFHQDWTVAGLIGDVSGDDKFQIGAKSNLSDAFHGLLDEVRVWNVTRTAEEVAATWNRTLPDPQSEMGLVGYWMFDEVGPVALDSSGFLYHGNLGGNNPATTPIRSLAPHLPGYALVYSGSCGDGLIDPLEACDDGAGAGGTGCSSTCRLETIFELQGDPMGGTIAIDVEGVTIQIQTDDGQTIDEVMVALAAAIQQNQTLAGMGVTATSSGSQLFIGGEFDNVTVTDPGLVDCETGFELPLITGPVVNLCPQTTIPLDTDAGLVEYQWLFEGQAIPGAVGPAYEATLSGSYSVRVGDGSGCMRESISEATFVTFCPETEISPGGAIFPLRLEKSAASPTGFYAYFQNVDDVEGFHLYEGTLGEWYSHGSNPANGCQIEECLVPNDVGCYDDPGTGELRMAISPGQSNSYFLISGYAAIEEGPTGFDSNAVRRDPAQDTCLP